jgi:hypothetical protein
LSLIGPNILLNTLFSNTLSPCCSLNVSDQIYSSTLISLYYSIIDAMGMMCNVCGAECHMVCLYILFTCTDLSLWKHSHIWVISGFHCNINEMCALLGFYVALNGCPVMKFRDNYCTSVRNYHFKLCKIPRECRLQSHLLKMYVGTLLNITGFVTLVQKVCQWIYAWKTNKCTNYSFNLLIMYGSSYMFWHYIAILRECS